MKKRLEKQNFLALFRYATPEEIEKAQGAGKQNSEGLLNEYSEEIKMMNNSNFLYKSILRHSAEVQKLDLCLEISE